jgi:uncharacterized membrane protein
MFEVLLLLVVGLNLSVDFMDRRAALQSAPNALSLWTTIVQFLLVVPLAGLTSRLTALQLGLCIVVGALSSLARIPWYRALSIPGEKLSRLAPFTRLSSVIALVAAFLLLGESFSFGKFIGGLLVIAGAIAMTMPPKRVSLADYFSANIAVFLVLLVALSSAAVSIFHKYLLDVGVSIISAYFYLKLFQFVFLVLHAIRHSYLRSSLSAISDFPLFLQARVIQTAAALLYLLVLREVDLSKVAPITAGAQPLMFLAVEKLLELSGGKAAKKQQAAPKRAQSAGMRYAAAAVVAIGLFMSAGG